MFRASIPFSFSYMKTATEITMQIEKLRKRGMLLENEALAKDFLLNVGYYRLGFYWFHFEQKELQDQQHPHQFKEGTRFEDIIELYKFDKNLRSLLVCYLNDIEFALKTRIIYFVSNAYLTNPTWFMDARVVNADVRKHTGKIYPTMIKNNEVIKKHHRKYPNDRYAPAWKTIEFFTFGDLCRLYSGILDHKMKVKIAEEFGIRNSKMMERYLAALRGLRNACAHGHNAYDLHFPKALPSNGALHIPAYAQLIGGVIEVIKYFLKQMKRCECSTFPEKLSVLIANQPAFVRTHIAQYGLN